MEEYLNWLKTMSPETTNITPQMRYETHVLLRGTPTFMLHDNPTVNGKKSVTVKIKLTNGNELSSHAAESSNDLTYSHNIYEQMLQKFDPLCVIGSRWMVQQILQKTQFSEEIKTHLSKTLTIFNIHYHAEQVLKTTWKNSTKYYTIVELQERIPLALTKLSLESKIKLSLKGKTDTNKIAHIANIPDEWFDRLNS